MYDKDVCIWQIFAIIVQGVHNNGQSLVNLYVIYLNKGLLCPELVEQ